MSTDLDTDFLNQIVIPQLCGRVHMVVSLVCYM